MSPNPPSPIFLMDDTELSSLDFKIFRETAAAGVIGSSFMSRAMMKITRVDGLQRPDSAATKKERRKEKKKGLVKYLRNRDFGHGTEIESHESRPKLYFLLKAQKRTRYHLAHDAAKHGQFE